MPGSTLLRAVRLALGLLLLTAVFTGADEPPPPVTEGDPAYHWFSLPIDLEGLPPGSAFVPVSWPVDFAALLNSIGAAGAVDERSIRLFHQATTEVEMPVQFDAAPQKRETTRVLRPGTPASVSFASEFPAGEVPNEVSARGDLSWAAHADAQGRARYRLAFGVPRSGSFVRVPFPPYNLRHFDEQGRAAAVRWFPTLQMHPQWPQDGIVTLSSAGVTVLTYHLGPTRQTARSGLIPARRPFVFPLIGPDGVGLTELGKPHDPTGSHSHHNGLWIAHNKVNDRDFWSDNGGLIVHDRFDEMIDGPVLARLVQSTRWLDGDNDLIHERRTWTLHQPQPDFRLLDVELSLAPAGQAEVVLGQTTFGFLAARVAQSMTVFDGAGVITNARGDRNERGCHLRHAEWLDQSGPIAPVLWGGIALLDHPENPNYPTVWHCRDDGWAGAAFCAEKPYRIKPGAPLRLRYRVLLHRGDVIAGAVSKRHAEFIARPRIVPGTLARRP